MGRRRRLLVIVGACGVVAAVGVGVNAVGDARVADELDRIRSTARTATVDPARYAMSTLSDAPDPVAAALGTDGSIDAVQGDGPSWCLTATVERLLSKGTVSFTLDEPGRLTEVDACPPDSRGR